MKEKIFTPEEFKEHNKYMERVFGVKGKTLFITSEDQTDELIAQLIDANNSIDTVYISINSTGGCIGDATEMVFDKDKKYIGTSENQASCSGYGNDNTYPIEAISKGFDLEFKKDGPIFIDNKNE